MPTESGERVGKGLGPFRPLTRVGDMVRRRAAPRRAAAIRFPPESDRARSPVPRANRQEIYPVALAQRLSVRSAGNFATLTKVYITMEVTTERGLCDDAAAGRTPSRKHLWEHNAGTATFWRKVGCRSSSWGRTTARNGTNVPGFTKGQGPLGHSFRRRKVRCDLGFRWSPSLRSLAPPFPSGTATLGAAGGPIFRFGVAPAKVYITTPKTMERNM